MQRRLLIAALVLGILLAAPAVAADVTGTWKAEFTTPDGTQRTSTFKFKTDGEKLTGTVAGSQDETKIDNGMVKGDEISFTAERPFGSFSYKGKVSGDSILFKVSFDGNDFDITAKRVSN
jgi:hypothetical protein